MVERENSLPILAPARTAFTLFGRRYRQQLLKVTRGSRMASMGRNGTSFPPMTSEDDGDGNVVPDIRTSTHRTRTYRQRRRYRQQLLGAAPGSPFSSPRWVANG